MAYSNDVPVNNCSVYHELCVRAVRTLVWAFGENIFSRLSAQEAFILDLSRESVCIRGWVHTMTSTTTILGEASNKAKPTRRSSYEA